MRARETAAPFSLPRAEARFCHWYPGEFRDGAIGWLRWWSLYRQIPSVQAEWRIHVTLAIGYALADEKHQQPFNDAKHDAFKDG